MLFRLILKNNVKSDLCHSLALCHGFTFVKIDFVRRIVAFTLIVCYTAGIFSPFIVIAGYLLHRDYIATSLCVKRSEPQSTCHGSCYLTKELADAAEPVKAQSNTKTSIQVFSPQEIYVDFQCPHYEALLSHRIVWNVTPSDNKFYPEVFAPPEWIV